MKDKKIFILLVVLGMSCILLGGSWAFFSYSRTGVNNEIITGEVFLNFYNESDSIYLLNAFPESAEEARAETGNTVTFDVLGRDTYKKPIYYEIDLVEGDDDEDRTRIDPTYLRFDLKEDGNLILSNMSYDDLNNRRIYVTTVPAYTSTDLIHSYELRMWIDEDLWISDTDEGADYTAVEFRNLYASVKVRVVGDFLEKSVYGIMGNTWPAGIVSNRANVTKINVLDDTEENIQNRYDAATIKGDMTYESTGVTDISNDSNKKYQVKMLTNEPDEIFENSGTDYFFPTGYSKVLVWLEDDPHNTGKYILNIGTTGYTYISNGSSLFASFSNVTEINLSNLRTDFASSMNAMFVSDNHLTSLDVSKFNTSNVTDMANMFNGCSSLTNLDLSNFDTSKVTNMSAMFSNCLGIMDLDLSVLDVHNVTNFNGMFNASGIVNLNLSGWDLTVANSIPLHSMALPQTLKNLDTSNWRLNNSKTGFIGELTGFSFEHIDVSGWNTGHVTNLAGLFSGSSKLKSIDLSSWDTSNVTEMGGMFSGCNALTSINLDNWNFSRITYTHAASNDYGFMRTRLGLPSYATVTDLSLNNVNFGTLDLYNCFGGFSGLTNLSLNNVDTSHVTNMSSMFSNCPNLINLDVSDFDTESVTTMSNMFIGCSKLKSLDLSSWDTSSVTNVSYMFCACYSLEQLNISSFVFANERYASSSVQMNSLISNYSVIFNTVGSSLPSGTYTKIYAKDVYQVYWILNDSSNMHSSNWTYDNVMVDTGQMQLSSTPTCMFTSISNPGFVISSEYTTIYLKLVCKSNNGFNDSAITSSDFDVLSSAADIIIGTPTKRAIEKGFEYTIPITSSCTQCNKSGDSYPSITLRANVLTSGSSNGNSSLVSPQFYNRRHDN